MKSIITIVLLLSVLTSYGQKTKTKPCSRCLPYADNLTAVDSLRLWIDKVDHMYANLANQSIRLNRLCDEIDSLKIRIEALESRPFLFFRIDSSWRLSNNPINTFVTGTAVPDSAIKRKP